jgi:hypothetical protein
LWCTVPMAFFSSIGNTKHVDELNSAFFFHYSQAYLSIIRVGELIEIDCWKTIIVSSRLICSLQIDLFLDRLASLSNNESNYSYKDIKQYNMLIFNYVIINSRRYIIKKWIIITQLSFNKRDLIFCWLKIKKYEIYVMHCYSVESHVIIRFFPV